MDEWHIAEFGYPPDSELDEPVKELDEPVKELDEARLNEVDLDSHVIKICSKDNSLCVILDRRERDD